MQRPLQSQGSEQSQKKILDAVEAIWRAEGMSKLTVAKVARRAGFSRQAIYSYFPTKEMLVSAYLMRASKQLLRKVERCFEQHSDDAARGAYHAILQLLTLTQTNQVLQQAQERDDLAPFLSSRGDLLLHLGREMISALLSRYFVLPEEQTLFPADTIVRLFISHLLTPSLDASREVVALQLTGSLLGSLYPHPSLEAFKTREPFS